jgi:hypothetical protein
MWMTEVKALILTYVGMSVLTITTCLALGATHAGETAWALSSGLLFALGGFLLSLVVMHYAPPEHRRH